MEFEPALIANAQAAELIEPGKGALHDPAVAAQAVAAFFAFAGDAHLDAPPVQRLATPGVIIAFVSVELLGPFARPAAPLANRVDGIQQAFKNSRIVAVRPRQTAD